VITVEYAPKRRAASVNAQAAVIRARREHATHFVYTLSGPSGVYVGLTSDPETRSKVHLSHARGSGWYPVHVAMRRDGVDTYRFEVIAQCRGLEDGWATERAVILQLRAAGDRVFNERPPAPGTKRKNAPRYYAALATEQRSA
jgi:hypothetical protein